MSMLISSLMFIALLAVSMAHFLWALGRTWPIRDEKLLAQTVVGFRDIERMPPRLASFGVALAALAAGIFGLALADHDSGGQAMTLFGLLASLPSSRADSSATPPGGSKRHPSPASVSTTAGSIPRSACCWDWASSPLPYCGWSNPPEPARLPCAAAGPRCAPRRTLHPDRPKRYQGSTRPQADAPPPALSAD